MEKGRSALLSRKSYSSIEMSPIGLESLTTQPTRPQIAMSLFSLRGRTVRPRYRSQRSCDRLWT